MTDILHISYCCDRWEEFSPMFIDKGIETYTTDYYPIIILDKMSANDTYNVITNNKSITSYDIYTSGKIEYLNDLLKINEISFNAANYPNELREKYHINNWIQTVFKV